MSRERVFSGIQPTGTLQLGNYLGAIKGMIELVEHYECIYGIVDYHAVTVPYNVEKMPQNKLNVAIGYLAAGLDPQKATLMVQSDVPEHTELAWLFGCITSVNKLEHLPTLKDKLETVDFFSSGLLNYPILQAADIVIYKATLVPVGRDQEAHIEFTREVVRKFNNTFGQTFPEPASYNTPGAIVPSLSGEGKMSKSVPGSYIALTDTPEEIWQKLAQTLTDPRRVRRDDPGDPEACPVIWQLHHIYTPEEKRAELAEGCRTAGIGCLQCKRELYRLMMEDLSPLQERWRDLAAHPDYVRDVLREGAARVRPIAQATMAEVREKMGLAGV
ncbi:MAG: tryptophan--tRNA ligase [Chloroflexia bacterium]|nr:tryptophan--tRNA ligase [Chloroflexia bacterium]